jgi:RNA polymerase sigma factor (sigma-70 family)
MKQKLIEQFLEHRNELFSYIRAMVRNTHDAENLFQEIAVAVIKKGENEEIRNYNAWIKQVARNQLKTIIRNKSRRKDLSLPSPEMMELLENSYLENDNPSDYFQDQYDALLKCLKKINSRVAGIIRRRFVEDQSYRHIAKVLDLSEEATRKSSLRARATLAECVKNQMNNGGI